MQTVLRKLMDQLRSGGWFFAAGLVAGILNYAFQVIASRELSSADFAALNGWFANLAIFFFLGGILQYGAIFFPSSGTRLRLQLLIINAATLALVWLWFVLPPALSLERAVIVLITSAAFGWVTGQVQFRLAFTALAVMGFVQAVLKVGFVALPWFANLRMEAYALSLFATFLPSLWIATAVLLRSEPTRAPEKIRGLKSWVAPVLLSCAVAIMPQYDLVLMSHTQSTGAFEEFARASLFYKGVYFVFFIVAQWMLPQQIHGKAEVRRLWLSVAFALVASLLITVFAPLVSRFILGWEHDPGAWLIFGSCVHMSLLTLAFLGIQQACADGRVGAAALTIALILAKGGIQLAMDLEASIYLVYAIVLQVPITWIVFAGRTNDRSQLITRDERETI